MQQWRYILKHNISREHAVCKKINIHVASTQIASALYKINPCFKLLQHIYLSLTNLSCLGSRGLRFMISDSACSYASEIAGTYVE